MLLGYGKMGKTIEQIAIQRGHQVPFKIDFGNIDELQKIKSTDVDVAIEFTQPESAYHNVKYCLENNIPVVCGTTGWLEKKAEMEALCRTTKGSFFYASNYSVGVNLFFHFNKMLGRIMNHHPEYDITMEEIHHTEKKDAPSGTAITLAEGLIETVSKKKAWINEASNEAELLPIFSKRIENVPGTHTISYRSAVDSIEMTHTAHSRQGFAEGAVIASEWLVGKEGVFGMEDMLKVVL